MGLKNKSGKKREKHDKKGKRRKMKRNRL